MFAWLQPAAWQSTARVLSTAAGLWHLVTFDTRVWKQNKQHLKYQPHKTGTALDQDFKILANNFFSIQAFNWKRVQLWVFMWTHYILQPLPEAAGWAIFDICDWLAEQRQRGGLLCTVTAKEPVDFTGSPGVKGRVCRIQGDLGRDMKYEWRVSPERTKQTAALDGAFQVLHIQRKGGWDKRKHATKSCQLVL